MNKLENPNFESTDQNDLPVQSEKPVTNEELQLGVSSSFDNNDSFDQLHEFIREEINREGNIQGTIAEYSSEDLKYIIDGVRSGQFEINTVTRTKGLREKVWQLLNSEHQTVTGRIEQETEAYETARAQLGLEPEIPPKTVALKSLCEEDTKIIELSKGFEAVEEKMESHVEKAQDQNTEAVSQSEKKEMAKGVRFETKARNYLINKIESYCESEGIKGDIVSIEDNPQFKEAIVFRREFSSEEKQEKMVRLYRAINLRDDRDDPDSIMNQLPYALRSVDEYGHITEMKEVEQEVKNLAENPTYDNMIAYANKVRPLLKNHLDSSILDEYVIKNEEGLLEGFSIRDSQIQNQFVWNGGSPHYATTPYVSVSSSPEGAVGYGSNALMVIDIPLSEIEDRESPTGRDSNETMLKGKIDKKYISAILARTVKFHFTKEEHKMIAKDAISKVNSVLEVPQLEGEEFESKMSVQIAERKSQDELIKNNDIAKVISKRLNQIKSKHPEVDFQTPEAGSSKELLEQYDAVKQKVFNYYLDRLSKLDEYSLTKEDINRERFGDGRGKYTNFDSSKITEKMLTALRNRTEAEEERYDDSKQRKTKRDTERNPVVGG